MNEREMIKRINDCLNSSWSKKERKKGKSLNVGWDLWRTINAVLPRYRSVGWLVTKNVETDGKERRLFLVFINPKIL